MTLLVLLAIGCRFGDDTTRLETVTNPPSREATDTGWWDPLPSYTCPGPPPGALEIDITGVDELSLTMGEENVTTAFGTNKFELRGVNYGGGCDPDVRDLTSEGEAGDALVRCSWATVVRRSTFLGEHLREGPGAISCYVDWKPTAETYTVLGPSGDDDLGWCISELQPDRMAGTFTFYDSWYDSWVYIRFHAQNTNLAWWQERGDLPCMYFYNHLPLGLAWSSAW